MENPHLEMDENWGYPYFRKLPYSRYVNWLIWIVNYQSKFMVLLVYGIYIYTYYAYYIAVDTTVCFLNQQHNWEAPPTAWPTLGRSRDSQGSLPGGYVKAPNP